MGVRVLVVEDEADLRTALVELLTIWGYRVFAARDGREALERLRAGQEPVLMLLDLQMPVMDGDALLDEVSRHPPERRLRIIVLSANLDVQRRAGPRPRGCRAQQASPSGTSPPGSGRRGPRPGVTAAPTGR